LFGSRVRTLHTIGRSVRICTVAKSSVRFSPVELTSRTGGTDRALRPIHRGAAAEAEHKKLMDLLNIELPKPAGK
jgi:hypothetical protein